jgi:hypothetical protein
MDAGAFGTDLCISLAINDTGRLTLRRWPWAMDLGNRSVSSRVHRSVFKWQAPGFASGAA